MKTMLTGFAASPYLLCGLQHATFPGVNSVTKNVPYFGQVPTLMARAIKITMADGTQLVQGAVTPGC